MTDRKNIYFASDLHLGFPNHEESLKREKLFVQWLEEIRRDASEIYLLGDMFDFWFEYHKVVPRGFTRFLGKISEITDSGIPVHYFTGNHDIWLKDYLTKETGITLHHGPFETQYNGKKFYIAHGDGLGPRDFGFKFIRSIFRNRVCQWLFARIHPNLGVAMGHFWSRRSRYNENPSSYQFRGEDREWLVLFAKEKLQQEHFDYFIFGHRHIVVDLKLTDNTRFLNIGDWLHNFSYAVFDGTELHTKKILQYG